MAVWQSNTRKHFHGDEVQGFSRVRTHGCRTAGRTAAPTQGCRPPRPPRASSASAPLCVYHSAMLCKAGARQELLSAPVHISVQFLGRIRTSTCQKHASCTRRAALGAHAINNACAACKNRLCAHVPISDAILWHEKQPHAVFLKSAE